ncbi:MAG: hypothetical protein FWC06_04135 [Treponema sp.]|nr:hypothetical protein [Treponema sp.]
MRERNNIRLICLYISFLITIPFFLCRCVGIVDKTGQILDGSASADKTVNIYRAYSSYNSPSDIDIEVVENKKKEKSIIITAKEFPMIKLRGTFPHDDGIFYFTSLEYIAGNTHGWNEFSQELYGTGKIILRESGTLEIIETMEKFNITRGRIHSYDTRITGNEALTSLRNRYDRIAALTDWMLTAKGIKGQTIKNFEKYWEPVLFPEAVSNNKRPDAWQRAGDIFRKAEDINWNISYTERTFPQELITVRNSGTMLRDWEEALSLVYLEYEWESFLNLFSKKLNIYKVK